MTNTRANTKREGDENGEQEVPPHVQAFMTLLSQALTTEVNREEVAPANPTGGMVSNRVREFLRINPSGFYVFKDDEDRNGLLMRCIRFKPGELREDNLEEFIDLNQEEIKIRKERDRENKMPRYEDDKSFHSKSEGQDMPRTKPRYSSQHCSKTSKVDKDKGSESSKSTCPKCGSSNYGKCLADTNDYSRCGKDGHKVRDCPAIKTKRREGKKVATNS
ncbi:hypothetical protein EJD97_007070 [Solanum chilense]|uniref:CCHC-type domain-containing protein n=1 Tax=Solanum chilense TaxID=4083 RepID=A0A6N2CGE0_SOLCI|nr:hypothetical protein EJD97_007070 [Solanum chilense]